jgi:steroid delta-isomerase-like uncharacterized protein
MPEHNISVARRLLEESWNKRDLKLTDQLLTPDSRNIDPAMPDLGTGPEAYNKLITLYTTAFPDLHFTLDEVIDAGDRVVVRWTASGTHKGELRGIAPTGKKFSLTGITINRFSNGKVAELRVIWDALGMMQQLGVLAPTGKVERAA